MSLNTVFSIFSPRAYEIRHDFMGKQDNKIVGTARET